METTEYFPYEKNKNKKYKIHVSNNRVVLLNDIQKKYK